MNEVETPSMTMMWTKATKLLTPTCLVWQIP